MEAIRINVNKQIDGYSFSLTPTVRDFIKTQFPGTHPANNIFVGYDTKSDFEVFIGKLERHIWPALLGVESTGDLSKLGDIEFVDTQTGEIIYTLSPHDEEV